MIRLFITLPIGISSAERPFSVLGLWTLRGDYRPSEFRSLPTHGKNLAGAHAIIDPHFAGPNFQEVCTGGPGSN